MPKQFLPLISELLNTEKNWQQPGVLNLQVIGKERSKNLNEKRKKSKNGSRTRKLQNLPETKAPNS